MKLTTNISLFQANKLRSNLFEVPHFDRKELQILDMKYDIEKGLMLKESAEENWDKRSF